MPKNKLQIAIEYCRTGRQAEALELFDRILAEDAQSQDALGHKAWLLRCMGRHSESIATFESLVRINRQNMHARGLLAQVKLEHGLVEEAIDEAIGILNLDRHNSLAVSVMQGALNALGKDGEAGKDYIFSSTEHPPNSTIALFEQSREKFPISVAPEIGQCLHALARMLKPRLAIEIGCHIGYSTLWMAQALSENELGHLHAIDLFNSSTNYVSPVVGRRAPTDEVVRAHLIHAGLINRVSLHKGDSSEILSRMADSGDMKVDFAFVDGDHTINGCIRDFAALSRLIERRAVIVLHDTNPSACNWLGPRYLVEELKKREMAGIEIVNLPTCDRLGLSLIVAEKVISEWRPSLKDMVYQRLYQKLVKRHQYHG